MRSICSVCAIVSIVLPGLAGAAGAGATGSVTRLWHGATVAATAPAPFELVFNGVHRPATFGSRTGLQHEGPFTSSAPFCSPGYAVDLRHVEPFAAVRRFSCADGSGSITARIDLFPAEHDVGEGSTWQIVEGAGQYATLRGKGTWTTTSVDGNPNDFATITFRTAWKGVAGLDNIPPAVAIVRASATGLQRPAATYSLRLSFSARDVPDGSAVEYRVRAIAAGHTLATRTGTTSGNVSLAFRLRPPKGSRTVRIAITASDPLGNVRTAVRSVDLRT